MRRSGLLVMATLVSSSAARADATCAVELHGDASVTEPIRAELQSFDEDGAPCVTVEVTCRRDGDQLEIELRDELGRSSLRLFTSAVGAAAFVVSWSKRPVVEELGIRPPSAAIVIPPPVAPPLRRPPRFGAPPEQGRHPELAATYITASSPDGDWGTMSAALMWQTWLLRYGGNVRAITSGTRYLRVEAEAIVGMVTMLPYAFSLRAELIGGVPLALLTASVDPAEYGAMGRRLGAALTVSKRLSRSLDVELGVGYDVSWQNLASSEVTSNESCSAVEIRCQTRRFTHAAAGLRWTL